MATTT